MEKDCGIIISGSWHIMFIFKWDIAYSKLLGWLWWSLSTVSNSVQGVVGIDCFQMYSTSRLGEWHLWHMPWVLDWKKCTDERSCRHLWLHHNGELLIENVCSFGHPFQSLPFDLESLNEENLRIPHSRCMLYTTNFVESISSEYKN